MLSQVIKVFIGTLIGFSLVQFNRMLEPTNPNGFERNLEFCHTTKFKGSQKVRNFPQRDPSGSKQQLNRQNSSLFCRTRLNFPLSTINRPRSLAAKSIDSTGLENRLDLKGRNIISAITFNMSFNNISVVIILALGKIPRSKIPRSKFEFELEF